MRKTTAAEIEKLHEFTRKHYVEYYDVEIELVDHLANSIEKRWQKNPESSFEENLQASFKEFGVFGFMDVVEKRQVAMMKKYLKLIGQECLSGIKKPKILFFILLIGFLCKFLLTFPEGFTILNALFLLEFLVMLTWIIKMGRLYGKQQKKYLLEHMILSAGGGFCLFLIPQYGVSIFSEETTNLYVQIGFAALFAIEALFIYVVLYVLPKKKNEILKKAYPTYGRTFA